MPISQNIQCQRHLRLNLERKLHTLGINNPYANQFNKDIFDKNVGLSDCLTEIDFENKLLELKPIWNLRECEARKTTESEFYTWFLKYKKDLVHNCLSLPLRISCGLGFSHYTTNANESLNNRLKQKTNYKESEISQFCAKLREITDEQKNDTEKAIIGMGPYQIRAEYMEHVQPSSAWFKISESSLKKHITAFLKAPLKLSKFGSSESVSVGDQAGTSGTSSAPQPERLSISLEETCLDPTIHEPIWKKAESLISSGLVNKAPGVQNGFMVASTSGKDPHFVRLLESGKGSCNCENFRLLSICSHVLAASEFGGQLRKLVKYLQKSQPTPNFEELSKINMPKHPQRKPNQRQRSNKRKPARDFGSSLSTMPTASTEDLESDNDGYYIKFLIGTQIRSCYGCGQPIRLPPHIPPPTV